MTSPAPRVQPWTSVLAGRKLRPGTELATTPRFSDMVWRLDAAQIQTHLTTLQLDFTTIPRRRQQVAKELFAAILSGQLPPGEKRLALGTISSLFPQVKRFLVWTDARTDQPVNSLRPGDLEDYVRLLAVEVPDAGYRENVSRAVRMLWRYRTLLSDPLRFDPQYVVDGWSRRSRNRTENVTPRIPEQVLGPLIAWSLRFVDDFAPDILAATDDSGSSRRVSAKGTVGRNAGATAALAAVLDDYITAGRPLPGTRRGANRAVLAAEAGISSIRRRDHQALIRAAEQTVGIDPYTWVPITISGQLDGQQWTNGISTNHHPTMSVKVLSRMLLAACYVLVAYLSGMRESEVKHLRRGCVAVRRTPDGTPYRWTVTGTAFKGASDPNGVEATWTVGAPVARAIEVLERLVRPDADLLFTFLTGSTGDTSRKTGPNQVFTTSATNMQLNDLCTWINSYCAAHARSDHIQQVDGAPWVLTTRQFRRTLAWFIARRPGGSVAGAIAYRHLSIHVFEGYAGTSASGFRAEVEAEQAILRGENLMAMIDQHEHTQLAGPAAKEAAARLAEFAQNVQFTGAVLTDPHRIKRLLSKSGGSIYPGKYSTCVFDARKALCLNGPASVDANPRLDHCQPLSCTNVALTRENVAHLNAEATELGRALDRVPTLPPMLYEQLGDRRQQIEVFLDRHAKDRP